MDTIDKCYGSIVFAFCEEWIQILNQMGIGFASADRHTPFDNSSPPR